MRPCNAGGIMRTDFNRSAEMSSLCICNLGDIVNGQTFPRRLSQSLRLRKFDESYRIVSDLQSRHSHYYSYRSDALNESNVFDVRKSTSQRGCNIVVTRRFVDVFNYKPST